MRGKKYTNSEDILDIFSDLDETVLSSVVSIYKGGKT